MQRHAEAAVREHLGGYLQDQFFREKAGKKYAPYSSEVSDQVEQLMTVAMKQTDRYRILKKAGFSVPDDISICGFSGGDLAIACDPMLTTVEQHGYEVGKTAAKLLIDKIRGTTHGQYTNRIIKTKLIMRGTTKQN